MTVHMLNFIFYIKLKVVCAEVIFYYVETIISIFHIDQEIN